MKCSFGLAIVMMGCAACYAGYSYSDVTIECWAGQGQNESLIVFDFNANESYAFGYRWDGLKSSFDALLAIDEACGDFSINYSWNDGVGGYFIESFSYQDASPRGSSWSFYNSSDGVQWSECWVGASDRLLTDGVWDGWASGDFVWMGPGDWDYAFTGSVTTPVPEPVTAALLGLAALFIRRRK